MAIQLRTKLDYRDYAAIPWDGKRHEIIEGNLYVTPAPSPNHQRVSKRLERQLEGYFEAKRLGEMFNAPIDLILSNRTILQPDLLLVADPDSITRRGIEAAPLLVVEVLSPGSIRQDKGVKSLAYASAGVPHYWIVDPKARRLDCHRLEEGAYRLVLSATESDRVQHPDWKGLTLDLGVLWNQDLRGA